MTGLGREPPNGLPKSSRWAGYLAAGSPEAVRKPDGSASKELDADGNGSGGLLQAVPIVLSMRRSEAGHSCRPK